MKKKSKLISVSLVLLSALLINTNASADLFGKLKSITDTVKDVGDIKVPGVGSGSTSGSGKGPSVQVNVEMPFGLELYPDASLINRFDDPFVKENFPISIPVGARGWEVDYKVATEGKLTILQFEHKRGDSALIIQKYYESWLAKNGFERLLVCESPCDKAPGVYWYPHLDFDKKVNYSQLPERATYIAAHKENAMIFVAVGARSEHYNSFVKVVEGKIVEDSAWKKLMKPREPMPLVDPSKPAPASTGAIFIPPKGSANAGMQDIAPNTLLTDIKKSKGLVAVNLSSYDANCGYCVKSNPQYERFAKKYDTRINFWRATAQPWRTAFDNDFAREYKVQGVPTTLLFQDGNLVRMLNGNVSAEELDKKLLQ
jgi:thiol-disulfide isomerase/thioredoxin